MPSLSYKGKTLVQNAHLAAPFLELASSNAKSHTKLINVHDNLIVPPAEVRCH